VRLRDLGEFELIARVERAVAKLPTARGVVVGIGDDAAVLRPRASEDVVVTTDALVERVHFRWKWASPRLVGRRALVASLSDLAAMGARPLGCVVSLVAPPSLPVRTLDGLVAGIVQEARAHACPLVGGNMSRGSETSLALTALGGVPRGRALTRSGVREGDRILVTGTLGAVALELARVQRRGGKLRRVATPRLEAGRVLARLPGLGGCIDISDGLDADLGHLLEGPGLGAEIDDARLPLARGLRSGSAALGLDPVPLARRGGEDYELLFTLHRAAPKTPELSRRLGVRVTEIGRVTAGQRRSGPMPPGGWRHF